jgi:hypothetical protein
VLVSTEKDANINKSSSDSARVFVYIHSKNTNIIFINIKIVRIFVD